MNSAVILKSGSASSRLTKRDHHERNAFRCSRLLRRNRRSRVQEDLSVPAGGGEARAFERAVNGVANENWDPNQSKALARDSVEKHGRLDPAAFGKLAGLLRYVDGDYADAATFAAVYTDLGGAQRPAHYPAIPRFCSGRFWSNSRPQFYDQIGTIRAGCQNHLFQVNGQPGDGATGAVEAIRHGGET